MAAIVRYNPFRIWDPFTNTDDDEWNWPYARENAALDMYEDENSVVVRIPLPGFTEKDVNITLEDRHLSVSGEISKEEEEQDKRRKWHRREISKTSFSRTVTLPTPVKTDGAEANFKDGVLEITLPKAEEAKPKTIQIKPGKK